MADNAFPSLSFYKSDWSVIQARVDATGSGETVSMSDAIVTPVTTGDLIQYKYNGGVDPDPVP